MTEGESSALFRLTKGWCCCRLLELSATKQKQENNLEAQEALAGRPRPRADGCHTHRQGSSLQSNLLRGANVPPPKSFALISPPLVPPPIRPQHVAAGDKLRDCLPSPPPTQATCSSPTLSLPIGWVSKEGETSWVPPLVNLSVLSPLVLTKPTDRPTYPPPTWRPIHPWIKWLTCTNRATHYPRPSLTSHPTTHPQIHSANEGRKEWVEWPMDGRLVGRTLLPTRQIHTSCLNDNKPPT